MARPLRIEFAGALEGMLDGSEKPLGGIRRLLDERPADRNVPEQERIRRRPLLEEIKRMVGEHSGEAPSCSAPGRRSDAAGRAVAACLARPRHSATEARAACREPSRQPASACRVR